MNVSLDTLDEAKFDGRAPSNPREWEHLEKVIVVRSCAARIKEQWEILGALTTSAPPLPPVKPTAQDAERFPEQVAAAISLGQYVSATHRETLEICVRAMELAKNLNSVAVSAVGSALEIVDALCAGPAECQAKKHKLMRSLASHRELASHLEARDQLFTELGSPDKESPLGVLHLLHPRPHPEPEQDPDSSVLLRLRLLEDRDREECAEIMNVTVGNFDVILHRASKAFRQKYPPR